MGILSRLFGQASVDVPRILNAVAQNGGQGIVQVPYAVFSSYLRTHGTEHQSGGGAMECYLNLVGKRHKVVIDQGVFRGLERGQTLVTVKAGVDFSRATDEQIASVLQNSLSSFITGADTAYAVAWQIFAMAQSDYLNDCWGKGKLDAKVDSFHSPLIAKFSASGHKNVESQIDWHQFNALLNDTMIAIEDPLRRLTISYSVVEKQIKEWSLIS